MPTDDIALNKNLKTTTWNHSKNADFPSNGRRYIVVFTGDTVFLSLKVLKPGFRHCFLWIEHREGWIFYNFLKSRTLKVKFEHMPPEAIASVYTPPLRRAVIGTREPASPVPHWPHTCVQGVKRIIYLNNPLILTPYQLYLELIKNKVGDRV